MSTLTATLDHDMPNYRKGIVTGTFDTTENEGAANGLAGPAVDQIVLLPTSCVLTSFDAQCQNGAGSIRAKCNYDSTGTAANGTVLIESDCIGSETFRFIATFIGS